jgi:hypothetical protein
MIFRVLAPGNASGFINVINSNNVSINVSATVFGDIAGITSTSETNMTLAPNETRVFDFNTYLLSPGRYIGEIVFVFSPGGGKGQGAALSSSIIIFAEGNVTQPENQTGNQTSGDFGGTGKIVSEEALLIGGFVVIAAIIALALLTAYKKSRGI